jgi:hypothetical protein
MTSGHRALFVGEMPTAQRPMQSALADPTFSSRMRSASAGAEREFAEKAVAEARARRVLSAEQIRQLLVEKEDEKRS